MARRIVLRACALVLSGALSGAGCLEDLPEPLTCPPKEVVPTGDCLDALRTHTPGCMPAEDLVCLTGERSSCDCGAGECPAVENVCYPEGDCPPLVTATQAGATCAPIPASDFYDGLSPTPRCLCGCAACASVCDGKGPVVGVFQDPSLEIFAAPVADVSASAPDQGAIGLYVRWRGVPNAWVVVASAGDKQNELVAEQFYLLGEELGMGFQEQVLFDQPLLGELAYRWDKPEDKPVAVLFLPLGQTDRPAPSLFEVDCVVPFYVP